MIANADIAFEPGSLEALLEVATADACVGVVAPRLVMPDGNAQHSAHPFPSIPLALAFNLVLYRVVPGLGSGSALRGIGTRIHPESSTGRMEPYVARASPPFDAIGGFDPEQWLYAEDLDLQ